MILEIVSIQSGDAFSLGSQRCFPAELTPIGELLGLPDGRKLTGSQAYSFGFVF